MWRSSLEDEGARHFPVFLGRLFRVLQRLGLEQFLQFLDISFPFFPPGLAVDGVAPPT